MAMNENSNMNMNMLAMAMGRKFDHYNSTWMENFLCEKMKSADVIEVTDYDSFSKKTLNVFGTYALMEYFSISCHI